jgi:hypothetical protein
VDDLLRQSAVEQTWLVTGSSEFEGDVSAASALRRPADGLTVYRGSKLFLRGGWAGTRAQLTAGSPEQAETLIERCRIEVIILGKGTPLVVGDAVGRDPARWKIRKTGLNPELGIVFERVGGARAGLGEPLVQEP